MAQQESRSPRCNLQIKPVRARVAVNRGAYEIVKWFKLCRRDLRGRPRIRHKQPLIAAPKLYIHRRHQQHVLLGKAVPKRVVRNLVCLVEISYAVFGKWHTGMDGDPLGPGLKYFIIRVSDESL